MTFYALLMIRECGYVMSVDREGGREGGGGGGVNVLFFVVCE